MADEMWVRLDTNVPVTSSLPDWLNSVQASILVTLSYNRMDLKHHVLQTSLQRFPGLILRKHRYCLEHTSIPVVIFPVQTIMPRLSPYYLA